MILDKCANVEKKLDFPRVHAITLALALAPRRVRMPVQRDRKKTI